MRDTPAWRRHAPRRVISSSDTIWPIRLGPSGTLFRQPPALRNPSGIPPWFASLTGSPRSAFLPCFSAELKFVISHPRFYWGETGNAMTPSLFDLPIPASRPWVHTGYGFVLPDQNGWSRNLHFEAAWVVILTGLVYVISGLLGRHFRNNLLPAGASLTWRALSKDIANHLRFQRPDEAEAWSYNVLQRLTYLLVIFVLFPLAIWTGLAMSPAIVSVFPILATVCRRPPIRAHDSLFCVGASRPVSSDPHRHGL